MSQASVKLAIFYMVLISDALNKVSFPQQELPICAIASLSIEAGEFYIVRQSYAEPQQHKHWLIRNDRIEIAYDLCANECWFTTAKLWFFAFFVFVQICITVVATKIIENLKPIVHINNQIRRRYIKAKLLYHEIPNLLHNYHGVSLPSCQRELLRTVVDNVIDDLPDPLEKSCFDYALLCHSRFTIGLSPIALLNFATPSANSVLASPEKNDYGFNTGAYPSTGVFEEDLISSSTTANGISSSTASELISSNTRNHGFSTSSYSSSTSFENDSPKSVPSSVDLKPIATNKFNCSSSTTSSNASFFDDEFVSTQRAQPVLTEDARPVTPEQSDEDSSADLDTKFNTNSRGNTSDLLSSNVIFDSENSLRSVDIEQSVDDAFADLDLHFNPISRTNSSDSLVVNLDSGSENSFTSDESGYSGESDTPVYDAD